MKPTNITQWNVTYQKQLKGDWMASASYIGNKTSHLWLGYDMTPPPRWRDPDIGHHRPPPAVPGQARGWALIGNLLMLDDGANANYNGLLLSLQHRFNHGFTLLSNYTWSHCLSDGDSVGNLRQGYYQIQNNRNADYGNCNYDVTQIFNTRLFTSARLWGKASPQVLGNWQFAPILRATSGMAINVGSGADNSGSGILRS